MLSMFKFEVFKGFKDWDEIGFKKKKSDEYPDLNNDALWWA